MKVTIGELKKLVAKYPTEETIVVFKGKQVVVEQQVDVLLADAKKVPATNGAQPVQ